MIGLSLMLNTLWCPRTNSNREPTDYKSIALPAELQGHDFICSINRLIIQLIQSIKDLSPARSCCCSQSFVPQCGSIVTNLSAYESVWESYFIWDLSKLFNFTKTNQKMEWNNYESNQIFE